MMVMLGIRPCWPMVAKMDKTNVDIFPKTDNSFDHQSLQGLYPLNQKKSYRQIS